MSEVQTATIQTDVPIGLLAEIVLFILQQSVYAPKPQGAVAAAGDNEVPIRTECKAQDSAGMAKVATTARMASDPRAVLMVVPGRQPTVFVLPQRPLRIR